MQTQIAELSVAAGVCVCAVAILFGPFFSPDEFSWLRQTTSEQAGQYMPGAWIMRAGFVSYGLGVFLASVLDWRRRRTARIATAFFGAGLIATAIWSNAPVIEGAPRDMHEDALHSVFSGVVGFAFAAACLARLFSPSRGQSDLLAWAGLAIAVFIPLAMGVLDDVRGLLQRAMFVFSFIFMLREFRSP